jgi:hypothetical protein
MPRRYYADCHVDHVAAQRNSLNSLSIAPPFFGSARCNADGGWQFPSRLLTVNAWRQDRREEQSGD